MEENNFLERNSEGNLRPAYRSMSLLILTMILIAELVVGVGSAANITLFSNFTANVTSGSAPLSIGLTDTSTSTNLFEQTEHFDTYYWRTFKSYLTPNATTDPLGGTAAYKLYEDNATAAYGSNDHYFGNNFRDGSVGTEGLLNLQDNTIYTTSIYAKAGERTWADISIRDNAGLWKGGYFNLTSGTVGSVYPTGTDTTITSTPVGSGWHRITATFNSNTTSGNLSSTIGFFIALDNNSNQYIGDNSSGLYYWGAMLNKGSTVLPYNEKKPYVNLVIPNIANGGESGLSTGVAKATSGDSVTSSTDQSWERFRSFKVVTANISADEGIQQIIDANLTPTYPYNASAYIKISGVPRTVYMSLCEYTQSGGYIGCSVGGSITLSNTSWTRFFINRTLTSNGARGRILIRTPTARGITFYVDGIQIENGALGSSWVDSSNPVTGWNWSYTNTTGNSTPVYFSVQNSPLLNLGVGNWIVALNSTIAGNYNISQKWVNVTASSITAQFTPTGPVSVWYPNGIAFTDTSTGSPTAWNWSYKISGLGSKIPFASTRNATFTPPAIGSYTIHLNITTPSGFADSAQTTWVYSTSPGGSGSLTSLSCQNQTGNISLWLNRSTETTLEWKWNSTEAISTLSLDGVFVSADLDNTTPFFTGYNFEPATWHAIKIYGTYLNATDYGRLNCITNATPIPTTSPTPIPNLPAAKQPAITDSIPWWGWVIAAVVVLLMIGRSGRRR